MSTPPPISTPTPVPPEPWYRNFWPWFIIAMLSSAVIGSFTSAYFAVHTKDVVLEHSDQAD